MLKASLLYQKFCCKKIEPEKYLNIQIQKNGSFLDTAIKIQQENSEMFRTTKHFTVFV